MAFNNQSFQLSFAGIPFVGDRAAGIPLFDNRGMEAEHHPARELIDELNKMIPWEYLRDFALPDNYPGKNTYGLAHTNELGPKPDPDIRIGDWYYPTGVRRWSVFRGLATSSQVKAMLAACTYQFTSSDTGFYSGAFAGYTSGSVPFSGTMNYPMEIPTTGTGTVPGRFVISCKPEGARNPTPNAVTTGMYMLPPRPLGEVAGKFDGLYLVTLVDERYYMQNTPASLQIQKGMTWEYLLNELAVVLGIELSTQSAIEPVYGYPELDSQLWTNQESAAALLEAVGYNVGRVVVRQYDGTYTLYTPLESQQVANANRGVVNPSALVSGHTTPFNVIRTAGGDMFYSGTALPAGSLTLAKNWVTPNSITITFPKYVVGNDPVPHFVDKRTQSERTAFYEDSYGDTFPVNVPIQSGGPNVSGLVGQSDMYLHDTAKALLSGEVSIDSGTPLNHSGLVALSMRLAQDHYNSIAGTGLDEVYPGILQWQPEGLHDVLFTYSERNGGAFTRAMRKSWTDEVEEFQHATPNASGFTYTQPGVGGKAVSQVVRDSFGQSGSFVGLSGTVQFINPLFPNSGTWVQSGSVCTTLSETLLSGSFTAKFTSISHFPTQNRWWGKVTGSGLTDEVILFEGTSGGRAGAYSGNYVGVVQRGAAGTIQRQHENQSFLQQTTPDAGYNVNLTTYEKGQFVYPQEISSGGTLGVNIVPQTQTVCVLDTIGVVISGVQHFSGRVSVYDASRVISGGPWLPTDYVWVVDRTSGSVPTLSGLYDGQFVGYSVGQSGADAAPVYAVSEISADDLNVRAVVAGGGGIGPPSNSGRILMAPLLSGADRIIVNSLDGLPTANRYWIRLANSGWTSFASGYSVLLVEGTSGGVTSGPLLSGYVYYSGGGQTTLSTIAPTGLGFFQKIVFRQDYDNPVLVSGGYMLGASYNLAILTQSSGVNLISFAQGTTALGGSPNVGNLAWPGRWSGGVQEVVIQPQFSLLAVTSASGILWSGTVMYPARLITSDNEGNWFFDTLSGTGRQEVLLMRLNDLYSPGLVAIYSGGYIPPIQSGQLYRGMLLGYSSFVSGGTIGFPTEATLSRPVYAIDGVLPEEQIINIPTQTPVNDGGFSWLFGYIQQWNQLSGTLLTSPGDAFIALQTVAVRSPLGEGLVQARTYPCKRVGYRVFSGSSNNFPVYIADRHTISVIDLTAGLTYNDIEFITFLTTASGTPGLFVTPGTNNLSGSPRVVTVGYHA